MPDTMRAVVKAKPGPGAQLAEVPVPNPGAGEVLVRVKAVSICGTDLHIYRWDRWSEGRMRLPRIIGHELAGEVVELGPSVNALRSGDYVSCDSHVVCGRCFQCRTGQMHVCRNVLILGVDIDGCMAEYVKVPAKTVWVMDKSVPPEETCIQDPLGNAVYAALVEEVTGRTVLVIGCGAAGLFSVAVCRASGASKIFGVDVNDYRLNLARDAGADLVLNGSREPVVEKVLEATGGLGVDVFLEMSGHPDGLRQGLEALRHGGRASLLGIPGQPVELDIADLIVLKGATLYGIHGRRLFETWFQMSRLLESRRLNVAPIITHRFPLEDFEKGLQLMDQGNCGKVVLFP